ncbi:hypothetical protein BpHYR1_015488 [Brachionus plicatilis]|uniref:Uncharacterized protein n=1 Tax=Brachionus plicatilis TaxID=10195 RepID=A0A3M7T0M8_BRAPC|nr:hypothetical protein BpHYR1_015488 [Brachionus plicatilis]
MKKLFNTKLIIMSGPLLFWESKFSSLLVICSILNNSSGSWSHTCRQCEILVQKIRKSFCKQYKNLYKQINLFSLQITKNREDPYLDQNLFPHRVRWNLGFLNVL